MKASYRQAACDDVVRQFRYYLVTLNAPKSPCASEMPFGAPFNGRYEIDATKPGTVGFKPLFPGFAAASV